MCTIRGALEIPRARSHYLLRAEKKDHMLFAAAKGSKGSCAPILHSSGPPPASAMAPPSPPRMSLPGHLPGRPWALPPDHWGAQLLTWAIILPILAVAWHMSLSKTVGLVQDETMALQMATLDEEGRPTRPPPPMRRSFILSACAYATVTCWARVLVMVACVYVGVTLLLQVYRHLPPLFKPSLLLPLMDPNVLLDGVTTRHLRAHGVVLLTCLVAPLVPALLWVRATDLRDPRVARAKTLRLLFVLPILSLTGTGAHALAALGAALSA